MATELLDRPYGTWRAGLIPPTRPEDEPMEEPETPEEDDDLEDDTEE